MTSDVIDLRNVAGMMPALQPHERISPMRHSLPSTRLLRLALLGDAMTSGAMGLLLTTAAPPLASLLALPEPLLRGAGLVVLPYAGLVAWLGIRPRVPAWTLRCTIGLNLLWAVDSFLLPMLNMVAPNRLDAAFIMFQAAAVLGFAALQWAGLQRARSGAALASATA